MKFAYILNIVLNVNGCNVQMNADAYRLISRMGVA